MTESYATNRYLLFRYTFIIVEAMSRPRRLPDGVWGSQIVGCVSNIVSPIFLEKVSVLIYGTG